MEPDQIGTTDEKGVVTRKQGRKKVLCVVSKCGPKLITIGDLQFTVVETIWTNGHIGDRIYIFKGKRAPEGFDIKKFDPDGHFVMAEEGGMTKEIWRDVVTPIIINSAPVRRSGEWLLLSLDQLDCHVNEPVSLLKFWRNKIVVFGEYGSSSHMHQPLDLTVFNSLENSLDSENAFFIVTHGAQNLTQFEYSGLYRISADKAMNRSNIRSGFKSGGLYPLLDADTWLALHADKYNIKMTDKSNISSEQFREERRKDKRTYGDERTLEALNLSPRQPKRTKKRRLSLPHLHKPKTKKPRTNIIAESLSTAKLANHPERVEKITQEEKKREEMHKLIMCERAKKKVAKEKKKAEEKKKMHEKAAQIEKYKNITPVLTHAGYCKRPFPTVNQICKYLRKEKHVLKSSLENANAQNILDIWAEYS